MKKKIILTAVFAFLFHCACCFAQTSAIDLITPEDAKSLDNERWQETVTKLHQETQTLLKENDDLNAEYTFLKEKLSRMHTAVAAIKEEIVKQEEDKKKMHGLRSDQGRLLEESKLKLKGMEKEIAALEAQRNTLAARLGNDEEKIRLEKQKLDMLQMQKRDLILEQKLLDVSQNELKQTEDSRVKKLKNELEDLQAEEARLNSILTELQSQKARTPKEIEDLRQNNRSLGLEIKDLERQKQALIAENAKKVKENERLAALASKIPGDLIKQKLQAEAEVQKLEKRLETVQKTVNESAALLAEKREFMDEVIQMDAGNQALRAEITSLLEQISTLKQEISDLQNNR